MDENKIVEKLIELTSSDKIEWDYLDSKQNIYKNLGLTPKANSLDGTGSALITLTGGTLFDVSNSFYTTIGKNFIVIYSKADKTKLTAKSLSLVLVPNKFKDIRVVASDCNALFDLHIKIKTKFENSDDIIEDLFNIK